MTSKRPMEGPDTFRRAAFNVAGQLLDLAPALLGPGEARQAAQARVAAAVIGLRTEFRHGGAMVANALGMTLGFDPNDYVVELLDDMPGEMARVVSADVREWVARERPAPPFDRCARVAVDPGTRRPEDRGEGMLEGVARRAGDLDASAYVMFVPDRHRGVFLDSRGSRGWTHLTWEAVSATAPLLGDDRDVDIVFRAREERLAQALAERGEPSPQSEIRRREMEGRKRFLTARPEERGAVLQGLARALVEALDGSGPDEARGAVAGMKAALDAFVALEREGKSIDLVGERASAPRP